VKKYTIKQTFLISLAILVLCIIVDAFIFEGNLLTKGLGMILSGYLGFVIYRQEKRLLPAFLIGGLLGLLIELFFYLLVILGYYPVPETLQSTFDSHSQIWISFVFLVASIITGILYSIYSLIGALSSKWIWKSKTRSRI
jgi:hypothetical protein